MSEQQFTTEAQRRWDAIPAPGKARLLDHVWCTHCRASTKMINFYGRIERGDLILTGLCERCGGQVVRVVEGG